MSTIAVAVSGGMDSLLTLALLKERAERTGEALVAVHALLLPDSADANRARRLDAMEKQCDVLGVPLAVLDLREDFDRQVVAPFAADYEAGLTPNPCALCNPRVKFGLIFDRIREELSGVERIATGHYARTTEHPDWGVTLLRGDDPVKDQSYFLSLVPAERLARAVFPLGPWHKTDVPAALRERGLEPPLPSESQEICFIPGDDYRAFLSERAERENRNLPGPGSVRMKDGRVIARHRGLWHYTLGQRRGLGIPWHHPLYVIGKDFDDNTLIVGDKEDLAASRCTVGTLNFLVPFSGWPETLRARTRYRQQARPVRAILDGERLILDLVEPQSLPTPGQIAAVYSEDGAVLAGGIIES